LRKLDDAVVSGTIAESQGREIAIRGNDNTLLPHRSAHDLDVALVETKGDRAEMSLPAGVTLVLSRKSGAWKIEEIR